MGRGQPKKKATMNPPASVRVFSSIPNSTRGPSNKRNISGNGDTSIPVLETILEEVIDKESVGDAESPKLWVDTIKGNILASNGSTIEYTAPMIVNGDIEVHIEEQDVVSEKEL